jgi:TRAP-type C4-dicarboxylate transport system substrate-binding protein
MKWKIGALSVAAAALAFAAPAAAQDINLKLAHFVIPQHPYAKYLQEFTDLVAKKSGNKIKITIFPNQQMGRARATPILRAPARPTSRGSCTASRRAASR